jgi:hypothetical protein
MFPVLAKRVAAIQKRVPGAVFEFAKFFGSGVILATGFIHLRSSTLLLRPCTEQVDLVVAAQRRFLLFFHLLFLPC